VNPVPEHPHKVAERILEYADAEVSRAPKKHQLNILKALAEDLEMQIKAWESTEVTLSTPSGRAAVERLGQRLSEFAQRKADELMASRESRIRQWTEDENRKRCEHGWGHTKR
jgi:hypothetical protein